MRTVAAILWWLLAAGCFVSAGYDVVKLVLDVGRIGLSITAGLAFAVLVLMSISYACDALRKGLEGLDD